MDRGLFERATAFSWMKSGEGGPGEAFRRTEELGRLEKWDFGLKCNGWGVGLSGDGPRLMI